MRSYCILLVYTSLLGMVGNGPSSVCVCLSIVGIQPNLKSNPKEEEAEGITYHFVVFSSARDDQSW